MQFLPDWFWKGQLRTHQAFQEIAFEKNLTHQEGPTHQAIQDGGLPLDEGLVLGEQGGATKQDNDAQTDPVHGLDVAVFFVHPANLQERGHHGHSGGIKNTGQLERDEKQGNRKEIQE